MKYLNTEHTDKQQQVKCEVRLKGTLQQRAKGDVLLDVCASVTLTKLE